MPRAGIEPATHGFSVHCSTNWAIWARLIQDELRGQDLNLRPSGYEPDELPDCSTPRYYLLLLLYSIFSRISIVFNGRRWIRTTEASCSRFTVCPLWPLGNLPIIDYKALRCTYKYFSEACLQKNIYVGRWTFAKQMISRKSKTFEIPTLHLKWFLTFLWGFLLKADDRTRTDNLLITNQLLCQLSHIGINGAYRARTCDPLLVRQMLSQLS